MNMQSRIVARRDCGCQAFFQYLLECSSVRIVFTPHPEPRFPDQIRCIIFPEEK
jgi:hypothetical protein